jgi:hypothetical protein
MKFNDKELLFISGLTKAPVPFGIFLKYPVGRDGKEVGEEAVSGLIEKGLMTNDRKFTKSGMFAFKLWETYCKAEKHVAVGANFLALMPEEKAIMLSVKPVEDDSTVKEYELQYINRMMLVRQMLLEFDFLRSDAHDKPRFYPKPLKINEWIKNIEIYENRMIVIGLFETKNEAFESHNAIEEQAFYWDEDQGYIYDIVKQTERKADSRMLRIMIMKILEIDYGKYMMN